MFQDFVLQYSRIKPHWKHPNSPPEWTISVKGQGFELSAPMPKTTRSFIPHKGTTRLSLLLTFQQPSVLRKTLYVSVPDPLKYPAHPSHKQVLKRPGDLWHESSNGRSNTENWHRFVQSHWGKYSSLYLNTISQQKKAHPKSDPIHPWMLDHLRSVISKSSYRLQVFFYAPLIPGSLV